MTSKRLYYQRSKKTLLLIGGLCIGLAALTLCMWQSITLGSIHINSDIILETLSPLNQTVNDASQEELIISVIRLPRTLTAVMVGASIAVAGAVMQGVTRNPLADPGLLGINSGAAIAVVSSIFLFGVSSLNAYASFAFFGASCAAAAVYLLGALGRGGLTPLNLTIAGAALTALVSSLTVSLLVLNQQTLEEIRFWLAGSVAGRDISLLQHVAPYLVSGMLIALLLGRQLTILSLGEEIAKGLGQKTILIRLVAAVSVVLLAGGSVALAGPIGFVGLIVPHVVRSGVGSDYRWILPYCAIMGAILVVTADIIARLLIQPQELPVGLLMPLIGSPFFIYLTKSQVKG